MPSDARGLVDVEALRDAGGRARSPDSCSRTRTRSGCSRRRIQEITAMLHDAGGLVYYDGANLNAILGRCRPGDMGFDIVHINTHKTFATPHGGGGPGAGPVGVAEELVPLPARADRGSGTTRRNVPMGRGPSSLDRRLHGFHGNIGVLVRAYAYVFLHGARRAGRGQRARGAERELPGGAASRTISRSRIRTADRCTSSWRPAEALKRRHRGPRDGRREAADRPGVSPVHRVLPARGRGSDDGRADRDRDEGDARRRSPRPSARAAAEARTDPEVLHEAPVTTPVRRLDEARAARQLKLRWTAPDSPE